MRAKTNNSFSSRKSANLTDSLFPVVAEQSGSSESSEEDDLADFQRELDEELAREVEKLKKLEKEEKKVDLAEHTIPSFIPTDITEPHDTNELLSAEQIFITKFSSEEDKKFETVKEEDTSKDKIGGIGKNKNEGMEEEKNEYTGEDKNEYTGCLLYTSDAADE